MQAEEARIEQERIKKEIREKRKARREAMLYREGRNIDGTMNIVTIYRHSRRDIFMTTYNPANGEKFSFTMRIDDLRRILEAAHNRGELTNNELFLKSNLRMLGDQLMYRRRMRKRVIVLSNKGGGERAA